MPATVQPIPDGYSAVTPYLTVNGASEAIEFYKKAFGAEEIMRMPRPDGKIMHAEIRIGGAPIMLHDEAPECQAMGAKTIGDTPCSLMLYVPDVDAVVKRAVDNGATLTMEVADQFYGDRCGGLTDPFGHKWAVATHVEEVSQEEIERRAKEKFKESATT